jgi:DNA-binding response OmpR family regulator
VSRLSKVLDVGCAMTNPIDVLVIEPSESDARRTLAAIRRKAPGLSTVHVSGAEVAAGLIFDYWPSELPQVPRLLIVDLTATGEPGKAVLRRLRGAAIRGNVRTVIFSAHPAPLDELEGSSPGAMNVLKPIDSDEYDVEVARVVDKLLLARP